MRVLYVTNAELARPYAPASRARGLSAALARRGMRVRLVAIGPLPSPIPGVRVDLVPHPRARKVGAVAWHAGLTARLAALASERYDVVLMREIPVAPEPAVFARLAGTPLVLEVNGRVPGFGRCDWARPFYSANYRAAAKIVVLTEPLGRYLTDEFGVPSSRWTVIPNAADTARFSPRSRAEARGRLGIPADAFAVVYMGSYDPQQGVEVVVPLAARVPRAHFLMTGDGPSRDALKAAAEREGVAARFQFLGALHDDRLADAVCAADAALSPIAPGQAWRTEATFPQKVVEYLACGVPVLAMGTSQAQREILEAGGCGRLVEPGPGHVDRLGEALDDWAKKPRLRSEMGARGLDLVKARFDYDSIAGRFVALFRELAR